MAIEVKQEPADFPWRKMGYENCCFCRKPTDTWYEPKDVACCSNCAKDKNPEDVPTKKEWCKAEAAFQDEAIHG
jgi:hypothetical protein